MSSSNDNNQERTQPSTPPNTQRSQNTNQDQANVPLFIPFTFVINSLSQNNSGDASNTSPPTPVPIQIPIPQSQTETPQNININIQIPPAPSANPTVNDPLPNNTPNGTAPFIHFFFYPLEEGATPAGMMFFTPFFMTTPEVQKPRASEQAMKKLPIVEITEKQVKEKVSCPICLDVFRMSNEKDSPVREMPCSHQFCESCLFEWLRQSNTCPLCRKEIEAEQVQDSNQQIPPQTEEMNNSARPMQGSNNNSNTMRQQQSRGSRHSPYTHRNANGRRPAASSCALDRVGCCGESNNSQTSESPSPIITLPQCHHRFHSSCLRTSLLVEGYSLDTPNLTFRCPTCRAPAQLRNEELKVGGRITNNNLSSNNTEPYYPEIDLD